jgi:hypothetical protein
MNAICLITLRPNKIYCDFLNSFVKYKIFVIVDDNTCDLSNIRRHYANIVFIQIEEEKCRTSGYIDTNFTLKKLISGWDKALYYFGIENKTYDFVWFIEDDVFFYNENTIVQIDNKYIDDDLLSNAYVENSNGNKNSWLWHRINIKYLPPYYQGMMCAIRVSTKMMNCITHYAKHIKTLFFLEALFPTIALKNKLKYSTPPEFNTIHYRYLFVKQNINTSNLYHPVKCMTRHIDFRQ